MTRIDSLKQQIADAKERMTVINGKAEAEKRIKTAEERTSFDALLLEVQGFEAELKDQEAVERIKIEAPAIITSEQKAKNRIYSATKAVDEWYNNRTVTGFEGEIQSIAKERNAKLKGLFIPDQLLYERTSFEALKRTAGITYANSTGLIPETASGLDIVAVPSLFEKVGTTIYEGLTTVHKQNYGQGVTSDKVAEGSKVSGKTRTKTSDSLEPARFGHVEIVSVENMAVASIVNDLIADGDRSCKVKIFLQLLTDILSDTGNTLTGYGTSATAAVMTSKILGALKASVLSPMFKRPGYLMGSSMFAELENTQAATTLKTVINEGKVNGIDAFDAMTLLGVHDTNKFDIIFADWARTYVGYWGLSGLELLINPYSNDEEGEVKFVFNRLADVSYNPYTVKCIRNAKLA
jgi:hypothetical protein